MVSYVIFKGYYYSLWIGLVLLKDAVVFVGSLPSFFTFKGLLYASRVLQNAVLAFLLMIYFCFTQQKKWIWAYNHGSNV